MLPAVANYKALRWAETVTTGKSGARQVLDKLCEKADDHGRVWRETDEIARFCEMGYRTASRHIDRLEELGLITQIRRIRPNASEAKPVILINYPEAAHLNGAITVLDYLAPDGTGVRVMYPRDPIGLLEARLRWSSNETPFGAHPSHADKVAKWLADQPANLAGGQPANLAGGATSENNDHPQVDQPANLAGGQPANLAGGATSENNDHRRSSGLPDWRGQSTHQPMHHPINQGGSASDAEQTPAGDGWMDDPSPNETPDGSAAPAGGSGVVQPFDDTKRDEVRRRRARKLIAAIQDERPEWHPVMTEAVERVVCAYANGKTDKEIRARLLSSFAGVRNVGAAITKRLRQLAPDESMPAKHGGKAKLDQDAADGEFLKQLRA